MLFENNKIKLERVTSNNVQQLVDWTLDPIAQGKYKVVPRMSRMELKNLFMNDQDREYFLVSTKSGQAIGRFYFRKWVFNANRSLIGS